MKSIAAATLVICMVLISTLWADQAATRPSNDTPASAAKPVSSTAPAISPSKEPQHLDLALVWIAHSQPAEYVFVLGGRGGLRDGLVGHKTVDSLKKHIADLPAGSSITWAPGCCRMGGEPLLSSKETMDAFKKFCDDHKVKLVIIPSG